MKSITDLGLPSVNKCCLNTRLSKDNCHLVGPRGTAWSLKEGLGLLLCPSPNSEAGGQMQPWPGTRTHLDLLI